MLLLCGCEQAAGGGPTPRLISVSIAESFEGLRLQPEVLSAGEITEWHWDFGAGALPSTSTDARPLLELGAHGDYAGSLTVTNAEGRSDTFDFSYQILPADPPELQAVAPMGVAGQELTDASFSAITTGETREWRWDFGEGAEPSRSEQPQPKVTLQVPGSYEGSLRLCGDRGCGAPVPFQYEVRASQLQWSVEPLREGISECQLFLTEGGRLAVLFEELVPIEPEGFQRQTILMQAEAAATPATLQWETMLLPLPDERTFITSGVESGEALLLSALVSSEDFRTHRTQLIKVPLDNPLAQTWSEPADLIGASGVARLPMKLAQETAFVHVNRGTEQGFWLAIPTNTWPDTNEALELTIAGGAPLRVMDIADVSGSLIMAWVTREGAQVKEPGTLVVARQVGKLSGSADAWVQVEIDRSARACPTLSIVPTTHGVHLLYGVFHGLETAYNQADGILYKQPGDFGLREAWTTNRQFTSAADWQTGRSVMLPHTQAASVVALRGASLFMGWRDADSLEDEGSSRLWVGRGYSAIAGDVPWQVEQQDFMGYIITNLTVESATENAWFAFTHHRDYYCSSGNGGTYCSPRDPVLMIGKVTLE